MAKIDLIAAAQAGWNIELSTGEIVEVAAWIVEKGAMAEVPQPAIIDPITNQLVVPASYVRMISPQIARIAAAIMEAFINNHELFDRVSKTSEQTDPGVGVDTVISTKSFVFAEAFADVLIARV